MSGLPVCGPLSPSLCDIRGYDNPLPAIENLVDLLLIEGIVGHDLLKW